MERKGSVVVYCIAILTDQEQEGQKSAEYIRNYCTEKHVFPLIEIYLYPKCGIIWCSDLDFSLHAFRLRIEYFFMKPVEEQKIKEGLSIWFECKKGGGYERKESN